MIVDNACRACRLLLTRLALGEVTKTSSDPFRAPPPIPPKSSELEAGFQPSDPQYQRLSSPRSGPLARIPTPFNVPDAKVGPNADSFTLSTPPVPPHCFQYDAERPR